MCIKYAIIDPVGRMVNWTKTKGIRFLSSEHNVTIWEDRKKPDSIVFKLNEGLTYLRGTKPDKFDGYVPEYKVGTIKKEGNQLIEI